MNDLLLSTLRTCKCCCLSLNTTYNTMMKLFFEGCQASFVSILCKVKREENAKKRLKIVVQDSVQVTKIDPVFWKLARNWEETRRQMRKCYLSKSLLPMRSMLELQKLLIKYSNKGVCLLLGSFPFLITCSHLHKNYG